MSKVPALFIAILLCSSFVAGSSAQVTRQAVITRTVDPANTVRLQGTMHPLVQPRFDIGAVDPGLRMERVIVALSAPQATQAELQSFLDRQQDKTSPDFHHWLTPDEFGQRFGAAPQDILTVKSWLEQQGLTVTAIAKSGLWMEVSGTSGQMERTFQTQMRRFQVNGETHIANATEISIPAAVAPVVRGVVSLHDFRKKPSSSRPLMVKANANGTYTPIAPDATLTTPSGPLHALTPGDYAKIYQLNDLYSGSLTGAGVHIAVIARSDISLQDYSDFRSLTNLPLGFVNNVLTAPPDPGFDPSSSDGVEATLDAQWAGAIAPGATVDVIVSASTATTDGVDLSAAYAVEHNTDEVLNVSFGQCEATLGPAGNTFFNSLWEQAAAQGISVFASTGDNGAAGCDHAESSTAAAGGLAVSGLASTPFNTAVGGTQFNENGRDTTFWSATNTTGGVSANGYIPEAVWNESCNPNTVGSPCVNLDFFLDAGSGGKSQIYAKPSWQAGFPAAPVDSSRDIPDVSLSAALHDGYIICLNSACGQGFVNIIGGTSASSPSFAGIMAIVVQAVTRQGLANYGLYRLAKGASASCGSSARLSPLIAAPAGCIFNDVTVGNNSVPGLTGFNAATGFDLATGLGSVNATNLVHGWQALTSVATSMTLSSNGGTTITAVHGTPVPLSVTVTAANAPAPNGSVAIFSNIARAIGDVPLTSAPNSAVATFNGTISNLPGGTTYALFAQFPGDTQNAVSTSNAVITTITPEPSTIGLHTFGVNAQGFAVSATSFSYGSFMDLHANVAGASGQGVATGNVAFNDSTTGTSLGSILLDPKGEAELFILPGVNAVPSALAPGAHTLVASYAGDASFNAPTPASLNVTITKGNPTVVINPVSNIAATQTGTLNAVVNNTGSILPTGTVQFFDGAATLGAPVQISSSRAALTTTFPTEGQHSISASYSGDNTYNAAVSAAVQVNVVAPFAFQASTTSATVVAGQTATYNLALGTPNSPSTFAGTVTLACSGAPAGTTCSVNPASVTFSPTSTGSPVTVTVTTTTSAAAHPLPFRGLPVVFAGVLALALCLKGNRKRLVMVGTVAVLAIGISSCGGGGSQTVTPTPTPVRGNTNATVVVTGTSGTHTTAINLQLTITH